MHFAPGLQMHKTKPHPLSLLLLGYPLQVRNLLLLAAVLRPLAQGCIMLVAITYTGPRMKLEHRFGSTCQEAVPNGPAVFIQHMQQAPDQQPARIENFTC